EFLRGTQIWAWLGPPARVACLFAPSKCQRWFKQFSNAIALCAELTFGAKNSGAPSQRAGVERHLTQLR
ncbi:MAG: hypothetical protein ABSC47_13125, partial [Terracidiphilus sp.]